VASESKPEPRPRPTCTATAARLHIFLGAPVYELVWLDMCATQQPSTRPVCRFCWLWVALGGGGMGGWVHTCVLPCDLTRLMTFSTNPS
jgi:hypothetical protein